MRKRFFRRYGFGIHSPFVYHLTTRVIAEKCPFYCFNEIEKVRAMLLANHDLLADGNEKKRTISGIVARRAVSPKTGALLFRLANHLKANNILQIGRTTGLSSLYLTSYRPGLRCVTVESGPDFAPISTIAHDRARTRIERHTGDYGTRLPLVLKTMPPLDLVYINIYGEADGKEIFDACLAHRHEGTAVVIKGIRRNRAMRHFWKYVRDHADVTVTIDLGRAGIAFFNPKLHKQNYKISF